MIGIRNEHYSLIMNQLMSYKFQGSLVPVYILDAHGSIEFRERRYESKSYFKMKIVRGVAGKF